MSESRKVKVLWLSRHNMTAEQAADLAAHPHLRMGLPWDTELQVVVTNINMMYPSVGQKAAEAILDIGEEHGADIIAGVFPAHVAVALSSRDQWYNDYTYYICHTLKGVMVPVSVPAPATEGETRGGGFVHSHWEAF